MKKGIIKRIVIIAIIIAMVCLIFSSESYGLATSTFKGADSMIKSAGDASVNIMKAILDAVRYIGAAVALAILMIIGIKYAVASAGERADIKKYAVNYIIGAIILFASSGIFTILKTFAEKTTK